MSPLPPTLAPAAVTHAGARLPPPPSSQSPPDPEFVDARPEEAFWSVPAPELEPRPAERIWLKGEYLLWWIRSAPVNTPLVTTGSAADAVPGALGQDNTQVLFGGAPLHFGAVSGIRVSGGIELSSGLGVEAGYFALERSSASFAAASDPNGNPLLARPVFNDQAPGENAYLYALPGTATGVIGVSTHTRLQGGEVNFAANLVDDPSVSFTVFAGFRMLELEEDLSVVGTIIPLVPGFLTFLGAAADPPNSYTDFDSFRTSNKFYGGQIGGRFTWRTARFDLGVVGKLALGSTQELVFINGVSALNTPGSPPTTNPGGLLTQPTNIGRYYHSSFEVIPEVGIDLGYWVTPQWRLSLGYSFLYWDRVARPGNQIDRTVSASQVARDPTFGTGEGDRPVFLFRQSAFWAQGVNFGVEFRY
jgi:hypothetical protein